MKKMMLLILALALLTLPAWAQGETIENWAVDSPAMQSIVAFVSESVDESAPGYIPVEDRVAVFDMDGTLYGERFPTYFNDWLYINRALYDEDYDAPEELRAYKWAAVKAGLAVALVFAVVFGLFIAFCDFVWFK